MLEILGLIAIGKWFNKTAKNNNLNATLWTIIGVASYFAGAFLMRVIVALTSPELLDQTLLLSLFGIVSGVIGAAIAYAFINSAIKRKKDQLEHSNEDLIDDNSFQSTVDNEFK